MFAEGERPERDLDLLSSPTAEMEKYVGLTFTICSSLWFGAEA